MLCTDLQWIWWWLIIALNMKPCDGPIYCSHLSISPQLVGSRYKKEKYCISCWNSIFKSIKIGQMVKWCKDSENNFRQKMKLKTPFKKLLGFSVLNIFCLKLQNFPLLTWLVFALQDIILNNFRILQIQIPLHIHV